MANTPGAGLVPAAKKEKVDVNYRQYESCASCDHFWAANNQCDLVNGNIGDNMICDLYEVKSQQPVSKDRSFYEAQYAKTQPKGV